ncbi:hypothetical protein BKA66DRAFT_507452 [Pyrenochaeta sp. MPI-SDFR-AT-0127]|nr:hypothetical protein BKA66DRAFT_507452 [Pyrenochaeta sp. MPI-SDFR-AT-0127]
MAASTSTMTFAPHQSSPLARTISPFKDPRPPPPCTPAKTAKLWDEYEKRALENARRRDGTTEVMSPQRSSASVVGKDDEMHSIPATTIMRSSFDFKFRRARVATPSTTVAICGTCKQPITFASGICERCKKTIILATSTGETTPPLSPSLHKDSSVEELTISPSTSPKRRSFCPLPSQLVEQPIRISSLRPPPVQEICLEPNRCRKTSLTDPNEPFLRLQIANQHASPHSYSHPTTPTHSNMPTTPPSTSHSRSSTRPSSLANIASINLFPYARNNSVTPSELSALYPYASTTTTSPPSLCRSSYALQNTTSAWDNWDSDEEEKVGLVGWMGRKKGKGKGTGKGSKGSIESLESLGIMDNMKSKTKKSREDERLEQARRETIEIVRANKSASAKKKRPSGFVRVISCGCSED